MERYESLGLVGEGSYGTVLKCRHRDTGRLVAIKKFTDSDSDKTVKKIATREIKLLRKLSHDNLVNLLEVWKRRRRWYLVFEFVDRTLLEDLEQHPSGLDLNTTRQYLYQILRAAAFCHEQNIIHRDIKPENILVSQGGVVKLCDFGLARTMASPAEGGVYTDYVATRWYRAPELLVGDLKYGKPVDVWAVGCLFLEMLTGQPLFPGDSDLDQIYHIIKCFGNLTAHHQELFTRSPAFSGVRLPECFVPVPLQDHCPTITPTALDLAQSCLQMDPEGRAQCSQLLEHPLFTLDCFHIRFLDELNAKIQKDHRENSTLPKIIKTPRHDKDDGNDKKQKGKNRKHLGSVDEKVIKGKEKKDWKEEEKLEKTRAKQPSNLPKTNQNKSDSLVSKQSKTVGANLIDNTTGALIDKKGNPGKATTSELRQEPDVCTIAKTFSSDLSEGTENRTGLKDNNKVAAKDEKQDHLKITENPEDADCSSLHCDQSGTAVPNETEKNMIDISRFSKSETSQEFWKNRSNTHLCAFSQSTTTDHPGSSLTLQVHPLSVNNYADVTTKSVTKLCKMDTGVEHQSIVAVPETQKVSDNADKEDLAQLAATSIVNQTSKIHGCSSSEQKNNETEPKSLLKEPQETFGSFVNNTKLTTTLTPKTVFHKEERKTSDNAGGKDAVYTSIAVRPTATTDHQTLTRGFVLYNVDTTTYNEFVHDSCPPPPPSSTPLLLPLPSTPLMPSFSVIGTNSPPTSDHLTLGPGFHPVSLSLRYGDKPRHHGGIYSRPGRLSLTTPITASQVSDKNLIREQSDHCNYVHSGCPAMAKKLDIHFPDVQSLGLPELRGRDGKNNKVIAKDQKKSKNPALHDSASDLHQYRHNSTDTYHTQKH